MHVDVGHSEAVCTVQEDARVVGFLALEAKHFNSGLISWSSAQFVPAHYSKYFESTELKDAF